MPKRSNEFQRLVFLVRKHAAPRARVTESHFLVDRYTKARREVDVCIEWRANRQSYVVCVECIDRSRRADQKWIDEMWGKHSRLPTTALILASRRGFTRLALKAAKSLGIQVVQLKERVGPVEFPLGSTGEVWEFKVVASPKVVTAVMAPDEHIMGPEKLVIEPDYLLHFADGSVAGVVIDFVKGAVHACLKNPGIGEPHTKFALVIRPVEWAEGMPVFFRRLGRDALRPIEALIVTGTLVVPPRNKVELRRATIDGLDTVWGRSDLLSGDLIVATTDSGGTERFSLGDEFLKPTKEAFLSRRKRRKSWLL